MSFNDDNNNDDVTLDLNELVAGLPDELVAEMEKIKASKNRGGKDTPDVSDDEKKFITQLVGMVLLNRTTKTAVIDKYKEMRSSKTSKEAAQSIREVWFSGVHQARSFTSFRNEFNDLHKQVQEQLAKQQKS